MQRISKYEVRLLWNTNNLSARPDVGLIPQKGMEKHILVQNTQSHNPPIDALHHGVFNATNHRFRFAVSNSRDVPSTSKPGQNGECPRNVLQYQGTLLYGSQR